MLSTTLKNLRCAGEQDYCGGEFRLLAAGGEVTAEKSVEVSSGKLKCRSCSKEFPILAGVAVLVPDFYTYLMSHAKGIARSVPDEQISKDFLSDYLEVKAEIESLPPELEEDLESERVIALYFANHYLRASELETSGTLIGSLVREHWDHGPRQRIEEWLSDRLKLQARVVELGCSVGGVAAALGGKLGSLQGGYLGIDDSFSSIALARHLVLGAPAPWKLRLPGDQLGGPLSGALPTPSSAVAGGQVDFVVGDLGAAPLEKSAWDYSLALNTIDMLAEPWRLPELQAEHLKAGGVAIQCSPYTWHPEAAKALRERLPRKIATSARAVEWAYEQAGYSIEWKESDVPWLFFKQPRQIEVYSSHIVAAQRREI